MTHLGSKDLRSVGRFALDEGCIRMTGDASEKEEVAFLSAWQNPFPDLCERNSEGDPLLHELVGTYYYLLGHISQPQLHGLPTSLAADIERLITQ